MSNALPNAYSPLIKLISVASACAAAATMGIAAAAPQQFVQGPTLGLRSNFSVRSIEEVALGDCDGDGHVDFIASVDTGTGGDHRLVARFGTGAGAFGSYEYLTSVAHNRTYHMSLADLDGNGFLDILIPEFPGGMIAWLPNLDGRSFGPKQVVHAGATNVRRARATDLDGDGDLDIVACGDDPGLKLFVVENLGGGTWSAPLVMIGATGGLIAYWIELFDCDGDGDEDFAVNLRNSNGTYRRVLVINEGSMTFATPAGIEVGVKASNSLRSSDIDGDGDLDLIAMSLGASGLSGDVLWHENVGGGVFRAEESILTTTSPGTIYPEDFDGDGLDDFAISSGNGVSWIPNQGGLTFGAEVSLSSDWSLFDKMDIVDVDGDGDADVVSHPSGYGAVWFRNTPLLSMEGTAPVGELLSPLDPLVNVTVNELVSGSLVPGGAMIIAETGFGSLEFPLVAVGGDQYQAELSGLECGQVISWQARATTLNGQPYESPTYRTWNVEDSAASLSFDMETDPGWTAGLPGDTATAGVWELVDPNGSDYAPGDDHSPSGTKCWVTQQEIVGNPNEQDVNDGFTSLLTGPIDVSASPNPHLAYWRWFAGYVDDRWTVEASDDGGASWLLIEEITPARHLGAGWERSTVRLADYVRTDGTIQFRFRVEDVGQPNTTEGALDDVEIISVDCGTIFTEFCSPAVPNVTGAPAVLRASGSVTAANNDLTLTTVGLGMGQFGYYVVGGTQAPNPGAGGGIGTVCVQAPLGRFLSQVQSSGSSGVIAIPVDLTALPTAPVTVVQPGETWHFQLWYRDLAPTGATSNFSNAVTLVFE